MFLDLAALALVVVAWFISRRAVSTRVWCVLMPLADQPPGAADEPWPPARRLNRYIRDGLREIDDYLVRRGSAVE